MKSVPLPQGDHTPLNYKLPVLNNSEVLKRIIRKFAYPIYKYINHIYLSRRYKTEDFIPDLWMLGQRGNDYESHRLRVARFIPLNNCNVLVAGCGTARDLESWVKLKPRYIHGVDWFSYARAWEMWITRFGKISPSVVVKFSQADLVKMSDFQNASFDLVSSDAVFEHLKNLPEVLKEFHRILRPGGILYATFGPLWYGWSGDHVSGYDNVTSGYNHLLLNGEEYQHYLDGLGAHSHSEHDGRTWIEHDLFSRLTPRQYLNCLEEAGFKRLFVSAIIDPSALTCLQHPEFNRSLLNNIDNLDLLISGMTIIYRR